MVYGVASSVMFCPATSARAANVRVHSAWLMRHTALAPGRSSSGRNARPIAGRTPSTSKKFHEKSYLMQDEPGGRGCFAYKMSLTRGSVMLGIDDQRDRKSTRLNSSHLVISYAVFCLKKNTKP